MKKRKSTQPKAVAATTEMDRFIDWLYNRVQNVHPLSNEQFVNILETKF